MKYLYFLECTVILLFALIFQNCQISDPEHKIKTYEIEDYTGFIARDFFQVVVEIPLEPSDKTILETREICKNLSIQKRNELTLPILKEIASSSSFNRERLRQVSIKKAWEEFPSFEAKKIQEEKKIQTHLGEFAWFFEKFFLYKEDYSQKDKCKFIYRNIDPNLYEKVENTKLVLPNPIEPSKKQEVPTPINPNLPTIPTGGNFR